MLPKSSDVLQNLFPLCSQQAPNTCVVLIKAVPIPMCCASFTFHASHVSTPSPVLPRRHGGDVVFWVCVHGLVHEGAIHIDGVVTAQKKSGQDSDAFPIFKLNILTCDFTQAVVWIYVKNVSLHHIVRVKRSVIRVVPFDGGILILCESPVCVWLLQLQKRTCHILIKKRNTHTGTTSLSRPL